MNTLKRFMSVQKIEEFLWYVFIILIPISLRHIFGYNPATFSEWSALSVYASDIVFGLLIILWLRHRQRIHFDAADWIVVLLGGIAVGSAVRASDARTALSAILKLGEGLLLYWYVRYYVSHVFEKEKIFFAFLIGAFFQSLIAIAQFITQASLGLKYFGEDVLNRTLPGIAAFYVHGQKFIRAYGTTVHPNILAAYLVIAVFGFLALYPTFFRQSVWMHGVYAVIIWGLLCTFSRTVIAIGAVMGALWVFTNWRMYKKVILVSVLVAIGFSALYWPLVSARATITNSDDAVVLRVLYNHEAISGSIKWWGIGIGNFVPWLMTRGLSLPPDEYQPVHNIYLLVYAELGLVGLIVFLVWIGLGIMRAVGAHDAWRDPLTRAIILSWLLILLVGLFDHFPWTLQSGRLLFWFLPGLI